ncbi:MAG: hypothetical protein EXQ53_07565 [Acidobacteria bacterium]|nr:hypothetical protein [Acidobacteriota bacterium]
MTRRQKNGPAQAGHYVRRAALIAFVCLLVRSSDAQAQGRGAPAPAATPRASAPLDPTGYWVAVISEDWRWRMITPAKGDFPSIPLNLAAQTVAEAWDPAKDEAAGEQCRAYGAPGLMRGPTRLHITWLDDATLKVESDYGMQTRLLHFRTPPPSQGAKTWQGVSTAQWVLAAGGRGRGGVRAGSLKSVTTQLRPGYLRKNGVPYSASTAFTEYWDVHTEATGDRYLVVTNVVDDPVYLQLPFSSALHFKQEPDATKWDPSPCDARF